MNISMNISTNINNKAPAQLINSGQQALGLDDLMHNINSSKTIVVVK